jgi:hypothetical protein
MPRRVEPELLDTLPADDPRAMRSRRDLRRVNRLMGTQAVIGDALDSIMQNNEQAHLVELGSGDGTLLLRLARSRAKRWPKVQLDLLDMQPVVRSETLTDFRSLGWDAQIIGADAFDWFAQTGNGDAAMRAPIVVANLFVHHFDGGRLQALLNGIAACAQAFVCCEPRRSRLALSGSRLLGAIGCNDVTRHDAVISVRAGFKGRELSELWPDRDAWTLLESRAGAFCHRFVAVRKDSVA